MSREFKRSALLVISFLPLLACLHPNVFAAPTYDFEVVSSESFDTGIPSGFQIHLGAGSTYEMDTVHKYDGTASILFNSSGAPAYTYKTFSLKPPLMFSIAVNVSVVNADTNFTRLNLGTQYNITLGIRRSDRAFVIFVNRDKYVHPALSLKDWYNFTLSVDQFDNLLKVLRDGTSIRSVTLSQNFPLCTTSSVTFASGIVEGNGTLNVDAFRLKSSPVVYVTPAVESPQNTQRNVVISGDLFRGSLSIYLRYPTGRIDRKDMLSFGLNGTQGFVEDMTLPAGAPAGTYKVNVSDTSGSVVYHFGAWNISSSTVRRKEKLKVRVGGLLPDGSFTVAINRSTTVTLRNNYPGVVNAEGEADIDLEVPANHPLGTFSIQLYGTGTFDNKFRSFSTSYYILTVEPALLNVTTNLNATLQRATDYEVRAYVRYQDGSTVPSSSSVYFRLYYGGFVRSQSQMTWDARGFWKCTVSVDENAPLSTNYMAVINATDPYGNAGGWSSLVQVVPAELRVVLNLIGDNFSRREYINATASVKYPKDIPMEQGKVVVKLKSGAISRTFELSHVEDGVWKGAYLISESERTGRWIVFVEAEDEFGNQGISGERTIEIVQAELKLKLLYGLPTSAQRGSKFEVLMKVTYPDGGEVRTGFSSLTLASANQTMSSELEYSTSEAAWRGLLALPRSLPPDVYEVVIKARDNYDNSGILRGSLNVEAAVLRLNVTLNRASLQSFFEELTVYVKALYPDGSEMTDGHVKVNLSSGSFNRSSEAVYKQGVGWVVSYRPSPFDPQGTYRLEVAAIDPYDNSGRALSEFSVNHLFFYVLIVGVVAIAAVSAVWWIRSRRKAAAGKRYNYIKYY